MSAVELSPQETVHVQLALEDRVRKVRMSANHASEQGDVIRAARGYETADILQTLLRRLYAHAAGERQHDAVRVLANLQQTARLLIGPDARAEEVRTGLRELEAGLAGLRKLLE